MTKDEALVFLKEQSHLKDVRFVSDDRWVAVYPLMFTHAVIWGTLSSAAIGYEDRWCYHDYDAAKKAIEEWDGVTGEPAGWHRHPASGRRRDENGEEWINP